MSSPYLHKMDAQRASFLGALVAQTLIVFEEALGLKAVFTTRFTELKCLGVVYEKKVKANNDGCSEKAKLA